MARHSWFDKHTMNARMSFVKALYVTVGLSLIIFALVHIGGALYVSSLAEKTSATFHAGIAHDLSYLKEQGDAIAKNELIAEYLLDSNYEKLLALLQKEKTDRSIGLMGVANSSGVVVGRTKTPGRKGDNVFLTSPVGRRVAEGKSIESIEGTTGFDPLQVFLTTGRPIMQDGKMVGALFANYLTDDVYATRFKNNYLPSGVEVLFYRKDVGVYGDSFTDPTIRKLINSYFNSGSDWVQNQGSEKTISFSDGTSYFVKSIVFPGLEKSPGGALIFIPRTDISNIANLLSALFASFVFIASALFYQRRSRRTVRCDWHHYVFLALCALLVFLLTFMGLRFIKGGFVKLERIPYTLYNSTLRLQPEFGIYDESFEQRFSIMVDAGDEPVNAVQVGLVFDPEAVTVKALDTASSTCSYVIENKIDIKEGRAYLSCVILKTERDKRSFPVADIVAVPRRIGTFEFSFDKTETKVLADDGLGTDVLRMSESGSYRVGDFDLSEEATSSTPDKNKRTFVVFSPTHPNQSRWYNEKTIRFVWRGKPDQVYVYSLDNSPDTIPTKEHSTRGTTLSIPAPGDGIFYFHLQLASGGPIAHYRVQIDQTPPSILSILQSSNTVVEGDVVRFSFQAEDTGSGVQKNYYIDLGSRLFLPVGSDLFVPFLEAGDQNVTLRVYDGAGNYSEKTQVVHVGTK